MTMTIHDLNTMELTIEDYESEYEGRWRIFNGQFWTHACNTKEQAIRRAKLWGGTAVGLAVFNEELGMNEYQEVERIRARERVSE